MKVDVLNTAGARFVVIHDNVGEFKVLVHEGLSPRNSLLSHARDLRDQSCEALAMAQRGSRI